jgi:ABC-type sugar transport system ATPase subunit
MASVSFDGVSKVYADGTPALADCTLHVADGELVTVVGPSGCGKSTLLRLLAGLESLTSGTVSIGGRIANDLTPQERNVAMVFQDYALYPFKTVRENIAFPLRMRRISREETARRLARIAALLDIADLLDRLPRQLSGGQRQRVAMGRALVREPSAFLLDEPLSNLDAKLRGQVRGEIAELQRRTGTTTIHVTHDQVEALTLGHRVAVLHRGVLQQVASPRELYERPVNVFVAGFIGTPPMNLFPARITGRAGAALVLAGAQIPIPPGDRHARLLAAPPGEPLTGGIRPEALHLIGADAGSDAPSVPATVARVECLGHETITEVQLDGGDPATAVRLTVLLPGMQQRAPGERVRVQIDPGRLYFFGQDGRTV